LAPVRTVRPVRCFVTSLDLRSVSLSLMVSVGISKLGCTDLIFVDPGVKINGAYYRDVLLSQQLLPVMIMLILV